MAKSFVFFALALFCIFNAAVANIASSAYVDNQLETKVDTRQGEKQTLAGEYVVTGTLEVPDAPLPPAD